MTARSEPRDPLALTDSTQRDPPALAGVGWPPVVVALAALAILVWLGRDMTFYHDEFAFLLLRDLSLPGSSRHTTST